MLPKLDRKSSLRFLATVALLTACGPSPATSATPTAVPFPGIVPTRTPGGAASPAGIVVIAQAAIPVEAAVTLQQQADGLSRRRSLTTGTGMLFLFDKSDYYGFWMKEMLIPLDFVWIDADCRVAELTANAPPPTPGTPDNELQVFRPRQPVRYVLEINGGEAQTHSIRTGSTVVFKGDALQSYGCSTP